MPFKLKESENDFQVTREGKFEYHHFEHGKIYQEIPEEEADRFEESQSAEVRSKKPKNNLSAI